MSKIGEYNPTEKYKRYSLITPKHDKTHPLYNEREKTLQDHIFKKLKKVSELLESIYPKLADDTSSNIKEVIESNLAILFDNLYLMQSHLHKNPYTFNTSKLKANLKSIAEMKKAADTLQTVSSFEIEFKKLSKIKHALHELEQQIEPKGIVALSTLKAPKKEKPKAPVKKTAPVKKAKPKVTSNKPKATVKKKAPVKKAKPKTLSNKPKAAKKPVKAKKKAPSVVAKSKKPVKTVKPKINSKSKPVVKKPIKAKKKATSVVAKSKKPVKTAKPINKSKAKKK